VHSLNIRIGKSSRRLTASTRFLLYILDGLYPTHSSSHAEAERRPNLRAALKLFLPRRFRTFAPGALPSIVALASHKLCLLSPMFYSQCNSIYPAPLNCRIRHSGAPPRKPASSFGRPRKIYVGQGGNLSAILHFHTTGRCARTFSDSLYSKR
jgi:hypothetical protein